MNSCITIKAFKRFEYFRQVIESLNNCIGIENIPVYIGIDPDASTKDRMLEAANLLKCKELHITYHETQQGCAGNTKWCFDQAFELNTYDYMIHLEDDTPVAPDFINWMLWAGKHMEDRVNMFAACPFTRRCSGGDVNKGTIDSSTFKDHFDCGGGFGMLRYQWEDIKSLGGMFGAVGNCGTLLPPEKWKHRNDLHITWKGSWAWPFNRYFRRGKLCIYPDMNRSNNIGSDQGLFNPNPQWHKDNIYVNRWAASDEFKNTEWTNLTYKLPG